MAYYGYAYRPDHSHYGVDTLHFNEGCAVYAQLQHVAGDNNQHHRADYQHTFSAAVPLAYPQSAEVNAVTKQEKLVQAHYQAIGDNVVEVVDLVKSLPSLRHYVVVAFYFPEACNQARRAYS